LASRALAMLARYRDGTVPAAASVTRLDEAGSEALRRYAGAMDRHDLRGGAEAVWGLVSEANLYVQQAAPWALAKEGRERELDEVLASLATCLYRLAVLTAPFVPGKAQTLWQALGQPGDPGIAPWASLAGPPVAGTATRKPEVLFPKPTPT